MASPTGKPRGRRPKVPTPEQTTTIVNTISATGLDKDAYILAGVPPATFYDWLARGRADVEHNRKSPFRDFAEAVDRAKSSRTVSLVASIRKAGMDPKLWNAAAWLLERTEPKRFGLRIRVHVDEELDAAGDCLEDEFKDEPETLARALAAIVRGRGGGASREASGSDDGADDSGGEAVPPPLPKPEAIVVPESLD